MAISKSDLKYILTNFRTRKSYFLFQVFQLIWSILIIFCAIISPKNFRSPLVLALQSVLLISMAIDLLFIRLISQGSLWTSKTNKIDCIVLIIFALTFVFMLATIQPQNGKNSGIQQKLLQTDDIILICIIVSRYVLQIYQMINTIKNTRKNMKIQKQMKDIDLNQQAGHSIVYDDHDLKQDEILRTKITQKHKQSKEDVIV